jgi:hypothetical protein
MVALDYVLVVAGCRRVCPSICAPLSSSVVDPNQTKGDDSVCCPGHYSTPFGYVVHMCLVSLSPKGGRVVATTSPVINFLVTAINLSSWLIVVFVMLPR